MGNIIFDTSQLTRFCAQLWFLIALSLRNLDFKHKPVFCNGVIDFFVQLFLHLNSLY